jgi:hypothetical protein
VKNDPTRIVSSSAAVASVGPFGVPVAVWRHPSPEVQLYAPTRRYTRYAASEPYTRPRQEAPAATAPATLEKTYLGKTQAELTPVEMGGRLPRWFYESFLGFPSDSERFNWDEYNVHCKLWLIRKLTAGKPNVSVLLLFFTSCFSPLNAP